MTRLSILLVTCRVAYVGANVRVAESSFIDHIADWNPLVIKHSTMACPVPIIGQMCPVGNEIYYFECCGEMNKDCCMKIQDWVTLVLSLLAVLVILLLISPCLCCIYCAINRE